MILRRSTSLVALTLIVCVGTATYAYQIQRARRVASRVAKLSLFSPDPAYTPTDYVRRWRDCPWYGQRTREQGWFPRRTYYEALREITGQDFPNDPAVWATWFSDPSRITSSDSQRRQMLTVDQYLDPSRTHHPDMNITGEMQFDCYERRPAKPFPPITKPSTSF